MEIINKKQLLAYAVRYKGNYASIKKALIENETYEDIKYEGKYICIYDTEYPDEFLDLANPPYVIFYEGDITLLKTRKISVVGSRNMSALGKEYCEALITYLAKSYTIVSGLAKGVDAYMHRLSLVSRKTIGVIGSGLNIMYPKENCYLYEAMRKTHLIISEYPNDTPPHAYHFPLRNRLIAALGKELIVVEAYVRSGTMLSVNEALNLNRDIYCFPHPFVIGNPSGCNVMIQEGAEVIVDVNTLKEL